MGIRFSRRRDAPAGSPEAAAPVEEPAAAPPAAAPPAEAPEQTPAQEGVKEDPVIIVGEAMKQVASLPDEACISECKLVDAPAAPATTDDAEPESAVKESLVPIQPEPVVSASEPSPPEPEPVAEAQVTPEPTPEPVPEPEPTSNVEAEVELVPEPISESASALEAPEEETGLFTHEPLPEPVVSSPPSTDMGVPDATPQPVDTPAIPPAPVDAEEPSDVPLIEESQEDVAEVSVISTLKPEECEEPSASLEEPTEVEAAGDLVQLVSDVNEENISGLLKNLDLKGNDLVSDLIPTDVNMTDDTLVTDVSASTDLI